jgi:hypothetical protein
MSIHFEAPGLRLNIHLLLSPTFDPTRSYEDWLNCDVELFVPGFTGAFSAYLQLADFTRFLSELREMYTRIGLSRKAALQGVEPGISIELTSDKLGAISGKYEFVNFPGNNKLTGNFSMDQSYLPSLVTDIETILQKISP